MLNSTKQAMKKIVSSAAFSLLMLSSYGQYMSFFGESSWSYSVTSVVYGDGYFLDNPPFDSVYLALNPLGTHCQTFVYCFDRKDSVYYQQNDSGLSGLYYHGNRDCDLAEELSEFYPPNEITISEYILDNSVKTILKEDRETGRLYRDEYLICDMSLSVGDTFLLEGQCSSFLPGGEDDWAYSPSDSAMIYRMIVDSVSYISGRKIIHLSLLDHKDDFFFGTEYLSPWGTPSYYHFSIRFIEGIGPTYGIIPKRCLNPTTYLGPVSYYLNYKQLLPLLQCAYKDGERVYMADESLDCNQTFVGVEEHYSKPIMNVFPNPATGYVNIDFSTNEEMNGVVAIIDMLGRTCKTQHAEGQTCKISVYDVPTGMYIITYTDKNRKITKKFLKR